MYLKQFSTKRTPQSEPIPGTAQVQNNAGGFTFAVDDWTRLDRFLILGAEGNTYYQTERELVVDNAQAVIRCVQADGIRTVERIREISTEGRAPKNDSALFAVAICLVYGDDATKRAVAAHIGDIARIGTDILHLAGYLDTIGKWGRAKRTAFQTWYTSRPAKDLAYQIVKYAQRDGWTHDDILRLAHPVPVTVQQQAIFHYITKGWESIGSEPHPDPDLRLLWAVERLKRDADVVSPQHAADFIRAYSIPREAVPTALLQSTPVWQALFDQMPLNALIRNLGTLTARGIFPPLSGNIARAVERITNTDALIKTRVHPLKLLVALRTYQQGHGEKGKLTWNPVPQIIDALDTAFYVAFKAAPVTHKRWYVGLDISGSMDGGTIAGMAGITPRVGATALCLVLAASEPHVHLTAFTAGSQRSRFGLSLGSGLSPLAISPNQRLDDAIRHVSALPMGGTDCALPMIYALKDRVPVDVFVVLTDNETWYGDIHPIQALRQYRAEMGIPAKLIVVAMTATPFSIADPDDAGCLDVVGFDTAVPALMAQFVEA